MSLCSEILAAQMTQPLLEPVAESAKILKGLLQSNDLPGLADALEEVDKSGLCMPIVATVSWPFSDSRYFPKP